MKNNDELLEQMIKEEFESAAKAEEAEILKDDSIIMPADKKEALYLKICEELEKLDKAGKIKPVEKLETAGEDVEEEPAGQRQEIEKQIEEEKIKIEREGKTGAEKQDNLYANMSEEDRRALEIGRRVMEEEARAEREGKVVRKKKRIQMYVGIAAALVLAMTAGLTSMGGPEKIIKIVTRMVGGREVEKVNSSEDNLVMVNEDEEEAYQKISEELGIMPVKVMVVSEKMKFVNMKLDEVLQTAELYYDYSGKQLIYFISASYKKDSFAYEIADEVIDKYFMDVEGKEVEITKYQVTGEDYMRFSADFEDSDLKYFLTGIMEQSEFELIVKNLHFFP